MSMIGTNLGNDGAGFIDECTLLDFVLTRVLSERKLDLLAKYLIVDAFMVNFILGQFAGFIGAVA